MRTALEATRPRALDLFCCAGGASMGLHRAGFDVTGVDIAERPEYPFAFVRGDALGVSLDGYDFIWASPPCQAHTAMSNRWRGRGGKADSHANLIHATRDRLIVTPSLWVIENVIGARAHLRAPIMLTGEMFGLGTHRPRLFEANFLILVPDRPTLDPSGVGIYGEHHDGRRLWTRKNGTELRAPRTLEQAGAAMGIDWMSWPTLKEAIPPAYAEFIGRAALRALRRAA